MLRRTRSGDSDSAGIRLQMTPMIDIVFQLLVFFVMTFRVFTQEGDFDVKMPLSGSGPVESSPTLKLRVKADAEGNLASIQLNELDFQTDWNALHEFIVSHVGDDRGPGGAGLADVELDCDFHLQYEHTIAAITAATGRVDSSGKVVPLVEQLRFAEPRNAVQR